jgi:hypothetical protein
MSALETLRASVTSVLTEENQLFRTLVPRADHFSATSDQPLHTAYYLRHRIETVHRIRATAKTDALALACMVDEDYDAARLWAHYLEQEMNHDRLFLEDLSRHNISREQVLSTPWFGSTAELVRYLTTRIASYGSLPAVTYSVFVEWNAERFSRVVVDRAAAAFSADHVKGARAHVGIDDKDGHVETMIQVAYRIVAKRGTSDLMFVLLREISALLRAYFTELHWWAITQPSWSTSLDNGIATTSPKRSEGDRPS